MVQPIYDRIGEGYDDTRQADPYLTQRLHALLDRSAKGPVLDVGCGTGNYAIALAERGLNITGVDPSEKMLTEARGKSAGVTWVSGSADAIPFSDGSFSGAIGTLTIHHWKKLDACFAELFRVLVRDGRLVLFTSTPEQMRGYWLNNYFPHMLERSMQVMPTLREVSDALLASGFHVRTTERYDVREDLRDLFLYSGKHAPQRYLEAGYRQGMSSFSALSDEQELKAGLAQLEEDIRSGAWSAVKDQYVHRLGDYLFLVAERS